MHVFIDSYLNFSCQQELDNRSPGHDAGFRGKAIKVMTELAKRSGRFPSALWLRDVPHDRVATAGGGFGDIHKGCWRNQEVALKFHRYFTQDHDRTTEMKKVNTTCMQSASA